METLPLPETDQTEELRRILECEQGRAVSYDEAKRTGEWLISFYEALGDSVPDEGEDQVVWPNNQRR